MIRSFIISDFLVELVSFDVEPVQVQYIHSYVNFELYVEIHY